jgi:hypothetical protein
MLGQHLHVPETTGIGKIVIACFLLLFLTVFTYRFVARGFGRGPEDT